MVGNRYVSKNVYCRGRGNRSKFPWVQAERSYRHHEQSNMPMQPIWTMSQYPSLHGWVYQPGVHGLQLFFDPSGSLCLQSSDLENKERRTNVYVNDLPSLQQLHEWLQQLSAVTKRGTQEPLSVSLTQQGPYPPSQLIATKAADDTFWTIDVVPGSPLPGCQWELPPEVIDALSEDIGRAVDIKLFTEPAYEGDPLDDDYYEDDYMFPYQQWLHTCGQLPAPIPAAEGVRPLADVLARRQR